MDRPEPDFPIETERMLLRPFEAGDLDALAILHGDEMLVRYIPWGPRDIDQVRATLERKMSRRTPLQEGDGIGLAGTLVPGGELIGDFTLQYLSEEHRTAEIGFMLHPDLHGRGLATEAARALLWLAFEGLGMHRVIGRVEERNEASARVLSRIGMRREAHLIENEFVKGEWQSEFVYALLSREWRDAPPAGSVD